MDERLPRKIAAILYADVAGYSQLTGEDEASIEMTLSYGESPQARAKRYVAGP